MPREVLARQRDDHGSESGNRGATAELLAGQGFRVAVNYRVDGRADLSADRHRRCDRVGELRELGARTVE